MRQIRIAFRNIRRTLINIIPILTLFVFFIILYGLLGLKLYQRHNLTYPDGRSYFQNFFDSAWDLFVLTTTANNPDVTLPASNFSSYSFLYFQSYQLFNAFLIQNILVAIIYNVFKHNLRNEVQKSVFIRRRLLSKAFQLISTTENSMEVVTKPSWHKLMSHCFPKYSMERKNVLFDLLRDKDETAISKRQFLKVANLLNLSIAEIHTTQIFWEIWIPSVYNSKASQFVRMAVKHRIFRIAFDILIVINAICIGLGIDEAEWAFLVLFLIEILLKFYVLGLMRFLKDKWNIFDVIIIGSAVIATTIEAIDEKERIENYTIDILLVLRVLRLLKIIGGIKQFKIIITTVVNLASSFGVYTMVVWTFYYFFAILGIEIFQGLYEPDQSNCGNMNLNGSEFLRLNYCSINFNDAFSAYIFIYHLLVVNQWHVLTRGLVAVTSPWARLYTLAIMFTFTLVIMNIVLAFIIEAFLLEFKLTKGEQDTDIERKIKQLGTIEREDTEEGSCLSHFVCCALQSKGESDPEAGNSSASTGNLEGEISSNDRKRLTRSPKCMIQFHLKTTSAKSVDTLLQHMFEHDLGSEETGPDVPLEELESHDLLSSTIENVQFQISHSLS